MVDKYIPDTKKNRKNFKQDKWAAKIIDTRQPLSGSDQVRHKDVKKDLSDYRVSRREDRKASKSIKRGGSSANRSKFVTRDNRAEVAKGSKASGVSVNNKMVRQGRVKAAENMVKKSKLKSVAKRTGLAGYAVGAAIQSADLGRSAGKSLRKMVDKSNAKKTQQQGTNRFKVRQMQKGK